MTELNLYNLDRVNQCAGADMYPPERFVVDQADNRCWTGLLDAVPGTGTAELGTHRPDSSRAKHSNKIHLLFNTYDRTA